MASHPGHAPDQPVQALEHAPVESRITLELGLDLVMMRPLCRGGFLGGVDMDMT